MNIAPSESKASQKEVRFDAPGAKEKKIENCLDVLKDVNQDLDQMWSSLDQNAQFKHPQKVVGQRGGSIDTGVEFQSVQEPATEAITMNES